MQIENRLYFTSMSPPKRHYKPLLYAPLSSMIKDQDEHLSKYFNICKDAIRLSPQDLYETSIYKEEMKQGMRYIAKRIKIHHWNKPQSLRELKIEFRDINLGNSAKQFGREICKNWKNLQRLSIGRIRGGSVKQVELKEVSRETNRRKLKHLKELEIDFAFGGGPRDGIKFQDLKWFTRRNFSQIEQLKLKRLSDEKIDDVWLASFISKLGDSINRLQGLSIEFFACPNITDQGINTLVKGIGKKFKALKELDLQFYRCVNITLKESSLFNFNGNGARVLSNLNTLSFDFDSCHRIDDEGFIKLLAGIENISQPLTDLSLRFRQCNEITDLGFKKLGSDLKNFSNLERLLLNFKSCKKITNRGIMGFASEGLKDLTQLKKLTLCFNKCQRIENEGISFLGSRISQYLGQLESLGVYCWDLQISSEYLLEFVQNITDKLNNLKQFNLNNLGFNRGNDEGQVIRNAELEVFLRGPIVSSYSSMSSYAELRALRDDRVRELSKLFDFLL